MISQWKIALWLGLLSELDNKETDSKNSQSRRKPQKTGASGSQKSSLPDGSSNKTWLIRGFAVLTLGTILYLIFGYGKATHIEIGDVTWDNSKLTLKSDTSDNKPEFKLPDWHKKSTTTASKVGFPHGEDIYEITTYDEHGYKVSFRVTKTKGKDNEDWVYKVPSGKTFSRKVDCKGTGNGTGTCSCNGSSGSSTGTCSCTGSGGSNGDCACCQFIKWVDYAILNIENPNKISTLSVFFSLLPSLIYIGFFIFVARSAMKGQGMGMYGQGGIFKIGQSLSKTAKSAITFKDVAGIDEEKYELEEIVDYLKNPEKYNVMGARTPRGVILYGPPGTGKTLLAKAVSGEAEVPFIEVAGSSFDDMFVGVGAKRVRELFAKAKKLAPCIVFIDEIDAVAGKRGNKFVGGGGGGVGDQTINQLLSEMDGFNTMTGVVIIAATNKLDSIDEAILRPGRFDRHIQIALPNIQGRIDILKIHARNKNLSSSVDLADVARKTPGFSGAQLENVLNEATLLAVRNNKKVIDRSDIDEAIDRVIAGPSKKSRKFIEEERKQIAYHEAGHAIAGLYSDKGESVEKITIIPRGNAAGYMLSAPSKQESFIKRKDELLATVLTTLAGRAAEEIFFGIDRISSGASNDLYKVTNLVRAMITKLGMSETMGLVQYEPSEGLENPYKASYSQKYSELIDKEMNKIIQTQYEKAKEIIETHKEEYLLIVECLLLIETIDKKQIDYIHKEKKLPKEALRMKEQLEKEGKAIDISVQP